VPRPDRNLLAAVLSALVALVAAPLLVGGTTTGASATTASVTARAASVDPVADPAARWPVAGEAVQAAVRLADAHWGGPACQGRVELRWTTLARGTNATAAWKNPTHAWDNPAENFDCRVELSTAAEFDWAKLCTVVTHELGHLHGRQHDDADVVMATYYRSPLTACERTPEPGAPAPAPAAPAPAAAAAPAAKGAPAIRRLQAPTGSRVVRRTARRVVARTPAARKASLRRLAARKAAARRIVARKAAARRAAAR
jgi:hypothetical protein